MLASIRFPLACEAPFDGAVVPLGEKSATADALTLRLSAAAIPLRRRHSPRGVS
jgi:hypothetical protein